MLEKSVRHCNQNTIVKYVTNLKKIVLKCARNGWLQSAPFTDFKLEKKEVIRIALTEQELKIIAEKSFAIERLNQVRDIFLFSC